MRFIVLAALAALLVATFACGCGGKADTEELTTDLSAGVDAEEYAVPDDKGQVRTTPPGT